MQGSSSIVSSLFPPGLRFSDRVRDRSEFGDARRRVLADFRGHRRRRCIGPDGLGVSEILRDGRSPTEGGEPGQYQERRADASHPAYGRGGTTRGTGVVETRVTGSRETVETSESWNALPPFVPAMIEPSPTESESTLGLSRPVEPAAQVVPPSVLSKTPPPLLPANTEPVAVSSARATTGTVTPDTGAHVSPPFELW